MSQGVGGDSVSVSLDEVVRVVMNHWPSITTVVGLLVVLPPALLLAILGGATLVERPLNERATNRVAQTCVFTALLAAVAILADMLIRGPRYIPIELGHWVQIPHYDYELLLVFDRLSVPFAILSLILCGTIGAFASRYMHREPGYNRFFVLYAVFQLGMVTAALAGTIETLFAGWELVGLSSALLVGFFQERPAPVRNGLRIWTVYRISDAALLLAAVVLHHLAGRGNFQQICGAGPWPYEKATIDPQQALLVGLLLLVAAAGKSGLVPFSGWLPRAMEGPTPSSAVYYGALSVHLGAFLLLRVGPILDLSPTLSTLVLGLGLVTAAFAALVGSVQTDIKSALSYASLTQVGLIVAEIGLGWRYIPLAHLLGHASLRTLQFVRAPNYLRERRSIENAIGRDLDRRGSWWSVIVPARMRGWLYRLGLERGYFDTALDNLLVRPFVNLLQACDRLERRWTNWLAGQASRESDEVIATISEAEVAS
jgi:NAD(P)H-quinone oxidoreductase subunit 5